jgi:hypothetical protein
MALTSRSAWGISIGLTILIIELLVGVGLWRGMLSVWEALAVRAGCVGAALAAAWLQRAAARNRDACILVAFWVALAGPFGAAIAALQNFVAVRGPRPVPENSFGAWIDEQISAQTTSKTWLFRSLVLDNRLRIEGASGIEPLYDIFHRDAQQPKLKALGVISRNFTPSMAPSLRLALKDTDAAVRVMAASVMAKLRKDYDDAALACLAAVKERGDAAASYQMARACLDFARSGLLSKERIMQERERGAQYARGAADLASSDAARLDIGALLLDLNRPADALQVLAAANPSDELTQARLNRMRIDATAHFEHARRVEEAAQQGAGGAT